MYEVDFFQCFADTLLHPLVCVLDKKCVICCCCCCCCCCCFSSFFEEKISEIRHFPRLFVPQLISSHNMHYFRKWGAVRTKEKDRRVRDWLIWSLYVYQTFEWNQSSCLRSLCCELLTLSVLSNFDTKFRLIHSVNVTTFFQDYFFFKGTLHRLGYFKCCLLLKHLISFH